VNVKCPQHQVYAHEYLDSARYAEVSRNWADGRGEQARGLEMGVDGECHHRGSDATAYGCARPWMRDEVCVDVSVSDAHVGMDGCKGSGCEEGSQIPKKTLKDSDALEQG
jgi:hypothetical protein